MLMSAKEVIDASMAARISLGDTGVAAHKGISSITSGTSVSASLSSCYLNRADQNTVSITGVAMLRVLKA